MEGILAWTLPTAQDEEDLKELFKQEWVEINHFHHAKSASGIGARLEVRL